jgi:4-hydroxy-3-methylbut-2-en-1-yl diphosphate reductase
MDIETARFGFCIGIERAYRGMDKRASQEAPFTVAHQNSTNAFDTLRRIETGDPELLRRYPSLSRVSVKHDLDALQDGDRLVLGFHGVTDRAKDELTARGVDVLDDLICPFIAKLDRVVEHHVLGGFDIAMVGSCDNHHLRTAKKIAADHGRRCFAIVKPEDIDTLPYEDGRPVVLVGEVTGNTQTFHQVIKRIEEAGLPVKIKKTMCSDSYQRQDQATALAARADVVILVDDGGDGANSVYQVCTQINARVHRVRSPSEIRPEWFEGAQKIAIVGGILVPEWTLQEVSRHVRMMGKANFEPG